MSAPLHLPAYATHTKGPIFITTGLRYKEAINIVEGTTELEKAGWVRKAGFRAGQLLITMTI